jgi:hypothetical protein
MPNNEFESRSGVELPPPARLESAIAQAFRVYRDKVAISMNYFITGSTAHRPCSGLERCIDLLTNHQFSFVQGVTTTGHQLHHPKGNHTTRLDPKQDKRNKHGSIAPMLRNSGWA